MGDKGVVNFFLLPSFMLLSDLFLPALVGEELGNEIIILCEFLLFLDFSVLHAVLKLLFLFLCAHQDRLGDAHDLSREVKQVRRGGRHIH